MRFSDFADFAVGFAKANELNSPTGTTARVLLLDWQPANLRSICDPEIVRARKQVGYRARRLRNPPDVTNQIALAALHTASGVIENERRNLDRGVNSRRVGERPHKRIIFDRSTRSGIKGGVSIKASRSMLHSAQNDPIPTRRKSLDADPSGHLSRLEIRYANRREGLGILRRSGR